MAVLLSIRSESKKAGAPAIRGNPAIPLVTEPVAFRPRLAAGLAFLMSNSNFTAWFDYKKKPFLSTENMPTEAALFL